MTETNCAFCAARLLPRRRKQELIVHHRVSRQCTLTLASTLWRVSDGADHALDRFCLMAPVDAHLDQLLRFRWIGIKSRVDTTGACAHRARVQLAAEAINSPFRGRVRTLTKHSVVNSRSPNSPPEEYFRSGLGLRAPIEGYSSYCIGRGRSGCLRGRSCGSHDISGTNMSF
jgi:hypothetical protein